jgi:hypothetical protein
MLLPPLSVDKNHHEGKKYVHFDVLKFRFSRMNLEYLQVTTSRNITGPDPNEMNL